MSKINMAKLFYDLSLADLQAVIQYLSQKLFYNSK